MACPGRLSSTHHGPLRTESSSREAAQGSSKPGATRGGLLSPSSASSGGCGECYEGGRTKSRSSLWSDCPSSTTHSSVPVRVVYESVEFSVSVFVDDSDAVLLPRILLLPVPRATDETELKSLWGSGYKRAKSAKKVPVTHSRVTVDTGGSPTGTGQGYGVTYVSRSDGPTPGPRT